MASKAKLYQALATESVANARRFLADARRLKRAGSRGHAIAFAILSIEESSKALIYRLVAQSVLRIVRKNANHVTTFTEGELLDHRFKHRVLAGSFVEYLRYGPFYEVAYGLKKPRFTKAEVQELVMRAVHAHRIMQVDLQSGGKAAQEIQRILELLEGLNELKNRGLYVDHFKARISTPRNIRSKQLKEVIGLAEGAIEMSTQAVRESLSEQEVRLQKEANAALLTSIRRVQRRGVKKGKPGPTPGRSRQGR